MTMLERMGYDAFLEGFEIHQYPQSYSVYEVAEWVSGWRLAEQETNSQEPELI